MKTVALPRGLAPAVALVAAAGLAWGALAPATAQEATPGADEPTAVVYVDEDGNELARVTVDEIVDPVADAPDGVAPADGERLVLVPLTVENTGEEDLPLDPVTFLLRDEGGFLYGLDDDLQDALAEDAATPAAGGDDATESPFEAGDLAPGEEREGVIGFAVREEAELAQVIFVPETGRLLILANLEEEDGASVRRTRSRSAAQDDDEDVTATATPRSARATATSATTSAAAATTPTPAPVAEPTAPVAPTTEPEPAVEVTEEPTAEVAAEPTPEATTAPDADGDGVPDTEEGDTVDDPTATVTETAAETVVAVEVTAPASEPTVEPTVAPVVGADSDADGLSDDEETALGSDPADADTDADGLPDGDEAGTYGTSPVDGDSDGDGIADIDEVIGSAVPTATTAP
ncbi:MAG: hypothetical protein AVDCRST_MAG19-4526 [uncultured Thermomicrobiales bacterium]|uniref:DUF4352 domain-containing protein n=1 Tax=uncultured Thermomicrobiales bacterium TaxID=1645740 RepID=A0A6J4VSE1_9BACT|nr:MAG: hypothetical protein AVDCRST_MAG19-4526 [uncultured Thermomicrobiales bacterium]